LAQSVVALEHWLMAETSCCSHGNQPVMRQQSSYRLNSPIFSSDVAIPPVHSFGTSFADPSGTCLTHSLSGVRVMKVFVMALGLVAVCGIAIAQDAQNRANPSHQKLDDHIAACLTLANQNEIAIAKIAEEKSSNQEVKSFAQQMEQDHTKFMSQLTKFGGNEFRNRDTSARAETSATPRNTDATKNESQDQGHMQIKRELADECLTSVRRELGQKSGQEFDDCYVGMQIAAHMGMVNELKVLERHASPELAAVLKEGQATAQKHLDHAKQLMKNLAKK